MAPKEDESGNGLESLGRGERSGIPGLIIAASVAYGLMFLAGWGWIQLRGDALVFSGAWGLGIEGGVGAGAGLLIGLGSAVLSRVSRHSRGLEREFRTLLGPLSSMEVLILAALSGLVEEVVFRAAVQPKLGLVLTSLLFGALHVGPGRVYLLWTVFAVGMGFLLGGLFEMTGGLAAPVCLHFTVNAINLTRIVRLPPVPREPVDEPRGEPPERG
ncbi:MAG: lysostaphin resistance A-like protein [Planctomycetota bacterium]|jgi:membrane protease YdiL (CAAX protease family)